MKRISLIGTGMGEGSLTREANDAIIRAEVLLGAPRLLERFQNPQKIARPFYLPGDAALCIENENAEEFAVLVSGDVGFYSAAAGLFKALSAYELRFIPGISSVNAFFAKLKMPWQDAAFVSLHGRTANAADAVRRSRLSFFLTGNNTNKIGSDLCEAGFGHLKAHVGENLGSEKERIYETDAKAIEQGEFSSLTVLLFVNEDFDDRTPCGLPDSTFIRAEGVPMTKSETRAQVMSKLRIRPGDVCWDVGAGTGSVTVEMALSAFRGHVYAVERREKCIPLIEQNRRAFHVGNVTAICGSAPAALEALPAPKAVFIGGSGGSLGEIILAVLSKNPNARIVITAVTVETAAAALSAFKSTGLEPEIVQINTARGKAAGGLHLMEAQNPVTILSAGAENE